MVKHLVRGLVAGLGLTLLCTAAAWAQTYHEDFGSGRLGPEWSTSSVHAPLSQVYRLIARPPGRIEVTDQEGPVTPAAPLFQPYHLIMDDPLFDHPLLSRTSVYNSAQLRVDLSGQTLDQILTVRARSVDEDFRARPSKLYFSEDAGQYFVRLTDFPPYPPSMADYPVYTIDLDALARRKGLALTSRSVLGFEDRSNGVLPERGFKIDEVTIDRFHVDPERPNLDEGDPWEDLIVEKITCPDWHPRCFPEPCEGLECPYRFDFERRWIDSRQQYFGVNGAHVRFVGDKGGNYLRFDAQEVLGDYALAMTALHLDLARFEEQGPVLSFRWRVTGEAPGKNDGLYYSDDGGKRFVLLHRLQEGSREWQPVEIELEAAVRAQGLGMSKEAVLVFAHYAYEGGPGGYELDDLLVSLPDGARKRTSSAPDASGRLEGNYPNPFNPTTHIAFRLDEPQDVRLEILDVTGRRVRTLVAGRQDAGAHTVQWNGRDDAGRPVASGVYLYRLHAGSSVETRRMFLLK